jgi:2-dehydropantoate 2-reductase
MSLRYAVVGTGALGGFYGGMLAKGGKEVHFLLNSDYRQVCEYGLRVDSVLGDFMLKPINAYASASAMPDADVVLVCLKTTSNHLLNELLKPLVTENTLVILIQNGFGIEQQVADKLPGIQIAGALAFICSNKVGPGHIKHLDLGRLTLGSFNVKNTALLEQVRTDFAEAGVPCQLTRDLNLARWQKLVWNVPFNGLTVVLNATTDQIMAHGASNRLAHEMMYEVVDAANACGVPLEHDFADKMMAMTAKMTPYAPSMKLDYDYKRPMEIDAIYSQAIARALKSGFRMVQVEMLEKQLHFYNSTNLQ